MSDVWDFKKDGNGHWTWQRQSLHHELIEAGRLSFKDLEECIADARRRGYAGSLSNAAEPPRDASAVCDVCRAAEPGRTAVPVDDWSFQQHNDGSWSWCSVTLRGTRASIERLASFVQALGNAVQHGFEPGVSRIAAIQADPPEES